MSKTEAPTPEQYSKWLDETATLIIGRLEQKIATFRATPPEEWAAIAQNNTSAAAPPPSDPEKIRKKFDYMEQLIAEHHGHTDRKPSSLHRIIRGFLTEFIRQSEERTIPCNTRYGRNPEAEAYWAERPEEFKKERNTGVMHTAFSFNHLRNRLPNKRDESSIFKTAGEIIHTAGEVFKEEYPKFDTRNPPNPVSLQ
jgi:hypothetical protein